MIQTSITISDPADPGDFIVTHGQEGVTLNFYEYPEPGFEPIQREVLLSRPFAAALGKALIG